MRHAIREECWVKPHRKVLPVRDRSVATLHVTEDESKVMQRAQRICEVLGLSHPAPGVVAEVATHVSGACAPLRKQISVLKKERALLKGKLRVGG